MKKIQITLYFFFSAFYITAQVDSTWNVLLLKKGNELEYKQNMGVFNNTGFYLYKNCMYEVELKNKKSIKGRLLNIQLDTLIFTNFFNANIAFAEAEKLDTFAIHYKDLDKLRLIADRILGVYNQYSFDDYNFIFKKDTTNYFLQGKWVNIFANDTTKYELVPYFTYQGFDILFEDDGKVYYFEGTKLMKPDLSKMDTTYNKKNFFWFTPCRVEEINGVAIGVLAENIKNDTFNKRDSLIIRGLNIDINMIFGVLGLVFSLEESRFDDSIAHYEEKLKKNWRVKIYGLNIGFTNVIDAMHGLNIVGTMTSIAEVHGVTISGVNNFTYIMNGVSIATLRNVTNIAKGVQIGTFNKAHNMKGVQIGLFNKCTNLRGFQFGLWNVNGKRSLPFINWQF